MVEHSKESRLSSTERSELVALFDARRYAEVERRAHILLERHPNAQGVWTLLASALLALDRLDEAEVSCRRALELKPGDVEAQSNLSTILRRRGYPLEAESICRHALDRNPNSVRLLLTLARLRADSGAFEEAERLLERAAALDSTSVEALGSLVYLRRMTEQDSAWLARVQKIFAEQRLSRRDEVFLRKAVGKYFDDLQDYERAFAQFRTANEIAKGYTPKYERQRIEQAVELIVSFHNQAWVSSCRSDNTSERPVFIVGMPRSGTTLAEQMLASHREVFGAGELSFWQLSVAKYRSSIFSAACGGLTRELAAEYVKLLGDLAGGALRVVDKMPGNFMHLGLIHAALPLARIIHLQRNPLDTCLSIYFQDFRTAHSYAVDLDDLAHYYTQYERLMEHWRRILPRGAMLEVSYEQLVDDPEMAARKLLEFIDLTWDIDCLRSTQHHRSVRTASNWQVRQQISKARLERWRHYESSIGPLLRLVRR